MRNASDFSVYPVNECVCFTRICL